MGTYILQKDLPDTKASNSDNEFIYNQNTGCYNRNGNPFSTSIPKEVVENNPDWFKLKEIKNK